jgi:hypothetical protein
MAINQKKNKAIGMMDSKNPSIATGFFAKQT